jgi:hypothetical protein
MKPEAHAKTSSSRTECYFKACSNLVTFSHANSRKFGHPNSVILSRHARSSNLISQTSFHQYTRRQQQVLTGCGSGNPVTATFKRQREFTKQMRNLERLILFRGTNTYIAITNRFHFENISFLCQPIKSLKDLL